MAQILKTIRGMRSWILNLLIYWFWPEIRLFIRWCNLSGRCTQAVRYRDYKKYLKEREAWEKREQENDRHKAIYG